MEPAVLLTLPVAVAGLWLASALVMLHIVGRESFIDRDDIAAAVVFGPISFVLLAYFWIGERLVSIRRRLRKEWRVLMGVLRG